MIKVNDERLWATIEEMAKIGATAGGGVRRLALSEEERAGRDLFVQWCKDAGLQVRIDAIGNIFGRRAGTDDQVKPVLCGSHLDTQPEGGRFDGAFGVLAALEVIRTLNDGNIATRRPVEIVSWTNEEGARFTPSLLGSAVFVGGTDIDTALAIVDSDGISVGQALERCGYDGKSSLTSEDVDSYFEAHIEQGPILEENKNVIGVVSGGQAIRWLDVDITGFASHAGTTPMARRNDAFNAAAEMAVALESLVAAGFDGAGLATIGQLSIANSSRNTIAGSVSMSVDLRHPKDGQMEMIHRTVRERFEEIAERRGVAVRISTYLDIPATPFDPGCMSLVQAAAQALGYPHQPIISGAGHDAINLTRKVPTAMVFIPCVNGLSHNEAEDASPSDVSAGANVLLNAVLARATAEISLS